MASPHPAYRRALATAAIAVLGVTTAPAWSPAPALAAVAAPTSAPASVDLKVGGLVDPLGIDDTTPTLQWRPGTGLLNQQAYQVRVASSAEKLSTPDLWDTGKVVGSTLQTTYAGRALDSRDRAVWQVRVWDAANRVSDWSAPGRFEIGLLSPADWQADWITNPEWVEPLHQDVTFTAPQTAQWIRLTVTDLGRPGEPLDDPGWRPRLELGEVVLRNGDDPANVVTGATVTASENKNQTGVWNPSFVVDGKLTTATAPRGYRSTYHPETDVKDKPIVLTIKLPEARTFDTVELYSMWDSPGQYGTTPNFPRDIAISTSTDGTSFTERAKATKLPAISTTHEAPDALPVFATDFKADDVASARLYVTGLGVYNASINGKPVSEDLLEPANTFHAKRVPYATYDVTDLLADGANSLGVEVGNGIFNVFNEPTPVGGTARYVKTASGHGAPRVLGQLELTDKAGNVTTVATGAGNGTPWRTTLGEVTFTNWYGGEDVDARRHLDGWDEAGTDRSSWATPVASQAPKATTRLVGRVQPPIRQVDELDTTWSQLANGDYLFDFGVNFAGWQQLNVSGPAGTAITMRPGERLNRDADGNPTGVNQDSSGKNAYDTFTLAGEGTETFTPRFRYHGMRWLQVSGLPSAPTAETLKGLVLRTSNEAVGGFETSHETLGKINTIIDRSVQSNMYSILTDCPHREKLGWLDQTNLNFDTVARGYDMQAQYRKMLQDVADSQTANGLIPTTAPEDSLFAGAFRHDANWGATMSVSAWQVYEEYGDRDPMERYWPNMVAYDEFLSSQATGFILPGGLNDWATPEEAANKVPDAFVQTYAWHKIVRTMADIATVLGKAAQARTYAQKADRIATAFDATYYNPTAKVYSVGSQAAQALALDEDLVPAERRQEAVDALLARITANGNQFMVGEVGLYALLRVLAEEGQDDLVHALATRPTGNSYAKFLGQGATSLPEHWSGMTSTGSQNHYMMGMLSGWLNGHLAGLRQAPGSVAWDHVLVEPSLVTGVDSASTSYDSVRGPIATAWKRTGAELTLDVTIPGNTVATVRVPNAADGTAAYGPRDAKVVPSEVDGYTQFEVGAGRHSFGSGGQAPSWASAVTITGATQVYGVRGEVVVDVTAADGRPVTDGTVTVTGLGAAQKVAVSGGQARFAAPATLAPGTRTLQAAYSGGDRLGGSAASGTLRVTKAKVRARTAVVKKPGVRSAGRIRVGLASTTGTAAGAKKAGGKVRVLLVKGGRTVAVTGTARNGVAVVRVARLPRGSWAIKVRYAGDARYTALTTTRTGTVTVKR
ncbi:MULTISPECIES: family 78 glycoside hydrolase catalytic domain [unclassified Nocardioides]|uniref:family 78 glycoside hydrolase catalytic domain n=1 Tax=unclassified Nocardioides TaxID=2615069 RepID=UPI00301554C6